jgi:hypothetical protein
MNLASKNDTLAQNQQSEGLRIVSKQEIEWIRTSEAAKILGVKTTQGALHILRGEGKVNPKWIVRHWNIGTDDMPRYLVAKEDVIALAEQRKS